MTDPKPKKIWRGIVVMTILVVVVVMAVASFPGWALQDFDAALHFAAFAVITGLTVLALPRVALSHIFVGLATLGGVTELLQFLPGIRRQPDWIDFAFNVFGITIMLVVVAMWRRRSGR